MINGQTLNALRVLLKGIIDQTISPLYRTRRVEIKLSAAFRIPIDVSVVFHTFLTPAVLPRDRSCIEDYVNKNSDKSSLLAKNRVDPCSKGKSRRVSHFGVIPCQEI